MSSSTGTAFPRAEPGFTTLRTARGKWDVFALRVGNDFVQIAESHKVRLQKARQLALSSLMPDVASLAALAVAIVLVVRHSMRPIEHLGRRVAMLAPGAPRPPVGADAPAELAPFVESLNRAMERLSVCKESERKFVANAAHALRTPIAAVQLQATNLHEAPVEHYAERLDELQRGISRVAALGSQLMALARADAGNTAETHAHASLPRVVYAVVTQI